MNRSEARQHVINPTEFWVPSLPFKKHSGSWFRYDDLKTFRRQPSCFATDQNAEEFGAQYGELSAEADWGQSSVFTFACAIIRTCLGLAMTTRST